MFNRRQFLQSLAISPLLLAGAGSGITKKQLRVAGVGTQYNRNSHCDVIFGKILEGWRQDGGEGPDLTLVSLYIDQFNEHDLARTMAEKHGFTICDSIEEALTFGTGKLQCDVVINIGEHGSYPTTGDTKQVKYPRRRFFDAVADTFQQTGKIVPVFNDKHLSYNWQDAKAMHARAEQMQIPFMAGSSLPFAWRYPAKQLPIGADIKTVMAVGFGGLESYGFHTLETMQCLAERRQGGEQGVQAVTALTYDQMWEAEKAGLWSRKMVEAALATSGESVTDLENRLNRDNSSIYIIEYRDGVKAVVPIFNGVTEQMTTCVELKNESELFAQWFRLEYKPPYGHFEKLLQGIEHFARTRVISTPVERTLLTTGILDRAMHSYHLGGKRLATPELAIRYKPGHWPFANQHEENFPLTE